MLFKILIIIAALATAWALFTLIRRRTTALSETHVESRGDERKALLRLLPGLVLGVVGVLGMLAQENETLAPWLGPPAPRQSQALDHGAIPDEALRRCINRIALQEDWSSAEDARQIHCPNNAIARLGGLEQFTRLAELDVSHNQLNDLAALGPQPHLRVLNLADNRLTSLDGLQGAPALHTLDAAANRIDDIEALQALTRLEQLKLGHNAIDDIEALAPLSALQGLDLSHNRITDLTPLESLTALRNLTLDHNQIGSLSALREAVQLRELTFKANRVSDLDPIEALPRLRTLGATDNPIPCPRLRAFKASHPKAMKFEANESCLGDD